MINHKVIASCCPLNYALGRGDRNKLFSLIRNKLLTEIRAFSVLVNAEMTAYNKWKMIAYVMLHKRFKQESLVTYAKKQCA